MSLRQTWEWKEGSAGLSSAPFSAAPTLSLGLPAQRGGCGPEAQAWSETGRPRVGWSRRHIWTVLTISEAPKARMGGAFWKNSGIRCVGTQGRWVQDWALILRARMGEHRASVGVGVLKDRLSTSMPAPGSLWLGEQSNPPPHPWNCHSQAPPSCPCLCLLQQCSLSASPCCMRPNKRVSQPSLCPVVSGGGEEGREGQTSQEAQTSRRCNMGGFCPRYRGVDISGARQSP